MMWEKQAAVNGFWEPQAKGDALEGELVEKREGPYGIQFILKDKEGGLHATKAWKVLISRMDRAKIGDMVRIVYQGKEETAIKGKNPANLFDVFIKRNEPKPAPANPTTDEMVEAFL